MDKFVATRKFIFAQSTPFFLNRYLGSSQLGPGHHTRKMKIFMFTLLIALSTAFHVSLNPSLCSFGLRKGHSISTKPQEFLFSTGRAGRFSLRAEASTEEAKSVDSGAAESPTVLSDDELEARIAAAGLDRVDTSIKEAENLTPIQQAMKTSAGLGKTAIATAANSAISVLNKLEKVFERFDSVCISTILTNNPLTADC